MTGTNPGQRGAQQRQIAGLNVVLQKIIRAVILRENSRLCLSRDILLAQKN